MTYSHTDIRKQRKELGLCKECAQPLNGLVSRCLECKTKHSAQMVNAANKSKDEVYKAYGDKCKHCGEANRKFLCIDHVNGGGNKEKKELGGVGIKLYKHIISLKFPADYQILCYNCNIKKSSQSIIKSDSRHSKRRAEIKLKVFTHYGLECVCCQENDYNILCIDHINGGGENHRREIVKGNNSKSATTYKWLLDNKFPEGFRVYCNNCNNGSSVNGGVCPHGK